MNPLTMKNYFLKIIQLLLYILLTIPIRLIYKLKININYKYKNNGMIFASNHIGYMDPFLISFSLPFKDALRIAPMRFVTNKRFFKSPVTGFLLTCVGGISTKKGILHKLINRLKNNESILIFPKGFIEKKNVVHKPKVGVIYLEKHTDSFIVPVKIQKNKIVFKKQLRHKTIPEDFQPLANDIIKKIQN